nr:AAA family ATPase [Methylobacterium sp. OTU13CASTA1]
MTTDLKNSLRANARRIAQQVEDANSIDDFLGHAAADGPGSGTGWSSPATMLALAMVREALPKGIASRLLTPNGIAVSVRVPSPGWVEPVHRALLGQGVWSEAYKRDGSQRLTDTNTSGNLAVAEALSKGRNVCGVSQDTARHLPAALTSLADISLDLAAPSNRMVADVIARVTGTRPRGLPANVARGLAVETIVACIRPGSSRDCVRRLVAASRTQAPTDPSLYAVPHIRDAVGYGEPLTAWSLGIVSAIEEYKRNERPWASIENRNIVISGGAGTGKTTFARILSKSTGLPLFTTSVSNWFTTGGYLNDVIKAADAAFSEASAAGPAILLLDECDSIPNRATLDSRHREYWTPLVSHILLKLDSVSSGASSSLIVLGATNFPERLDEALVRPGRLNRIIHIERPDLPAIAGILRQHLGKDLSDTDLMPVAAIGTGASGAEVAGWARGARMAARAAGRPMELDDLLQQLAPPDTRSPDLLWATALHEAAHGVCAEMDLPSCLVDMNIVARGRFAGQTTTRQRPHDGRTAEHMDGFVVSILAGRAADEHWHVATSGSAGAPGSDLAQATAIVGAKHASYGLGGTLLYRGNADEVRALIRNDAAFRNTVEADLSRLYELAREAVCRNAPTIEAVARRLLERRVLSGDEVRAIIAAHQLSGTPVDSPSANVGGNHA